MKTNLRLNNHPWRAKLLIPAFFALYLIMIPLNAVVETEHSEVFPFFRWTLFSKIPAWETTEFGLIVDAVDGEPTDGDQYLIPSQNVGDWKTLTSIAWACRQGDPCDDAVAAVLVPLVRQALGDSSVDFSIVEAKIDLRDVREGIYDLADGNAVRTDFYRPTRIIGKWNTETGRIGLVEDTG